MKKFFKIKVQIIFMKDFVRTPVAQGKDEKYYLFDENRGKCSKMQQLLQLMDGHAPCKNTGKQIKA